jgi:hypothetical protein
LKDIEGISIDIKPTKGKGNRWLRFRLKLRPDEIVNIKHATQVVVEDEASQELRGGATPLKYPGPIRYLTIGYYARPRKLTGKRTAGVIAEYVWEGIPRGAPEAKRTKTKRKAAA